MARFATLLAAVIGLTIGAAPALLAQTVPSAADLKLFGVCILGTLISMSACVRR